MQLVPPPEIQRFSFFNITMITQVSKKHCLLSLDYDGFGIVVIANFVQLHALSPRVHLHGKDAISLLNSPTLD